MWKTYDVELHFNSPFAASVPRHPKDIRAMLKNRAPSKPPPNAVPLPELAELIESEVDIDEEVERGEATFKRDEEGLYFEARCVKAHIKNCAEVLRVYLDIKALKPKIANRVYVLPVEKIYVDRKVGDNWERVKEPDGNEVRYIHVIGPRGPQNTLKGIDYILNARIIFQLEVLEDNIVGKKLLESLFDYGRVHGMGQERSQGWGRYTVARLEEAM